MHAPDPPAVADWAFDDASVGSTIQHRGGRTVGADEHVWLAWITNNASDLHGNVDAASRTEFKRAVVLGALTVAIVIGLAEPAEWPPAELARYRPLGWRSIRLTGLVLPGDTLRAESVIVGAEPFANGHGGLVRRVIVGRTQAGTEVARVEEERAVPNWGVPRTKDC
jgi:acyl dehydratase